MSVKSVGNGKTCILALHDWFGTGDSWAQTVQWLDPAKYTVALPDYRGYGSRMAETGSYTVDEIATDMLQVADELGWESFDVVGHSMGGKVAQKILALASTRVRKLVAVTPVPAGALPLDADTLAFFRSARTEAGSRNAVLRNGTSNRHSDFVYDAMTANSMSRSTPEAFAGYFESWALDDFSSSVAGKENDILIVVGEFDAVLTADVMRQAVLPLYPNATLLELKACGHYPIFEVPVTLASEIDRFLT